MRPRARYGQPKTLAMVHRREACCSFPVFAVSRSFSLRSCRRGTALLRDIIQHLCCIYKLILMPIISFL